MKKYNKYSSAFVALIAAGMIFSGSAKAADTEFSGFAAPTFLWSDGSTNNLGFHVRDGALYIMHKQGSAKAMVDLPFSFNSTSAGSFNFAMTQAQAYYHVMYDNGLNWRLGQWDRLNGFETVDLNGIPFTRGGFVRGAFSAVKAGATVGYDGGSYSIDILFNHPNGTTNHQATGAGNYEFGIHSDWLKGQSFELGLGAIAYNSVYTIDAIFGLGLGNLDLDIEGVFQTGGAETGIGILARLMTDFSDDMSGGVRIEYGSNLATAGSAAAANDSQIAVTVGPQFKVTKAMLLKLDYTFDSTTPSGGSAATSHIAGLGATYSF